MQTPSDTPRNHPSVPVSSGFLLYPSCPEREADTRDWGLGFTVCCYNPKLQTLLWEVTGESTESHVRTPEQFWMKRCPA